MGCIIQNENHANFKILKELKQTIDQKKALILSFKMTP